MSRTSDGSAQIGNIRPGERVLWTGRPDPHKIFGPGDAFLVPFSVMWLAFALFWEASVLGTGAPVFFPIWGGIFVCIGLYFVFGRFIAKRARCNRSAYAVTDRRAIISQGRSVHDMPLANQQVDVRRSRDGRHASVTIGGTASRGWNQMAAGLYANSGMEFFARGTAAPFAFYDVVDPQPMLTALDSARARLDC